MFIPTVSSLDIGEGKVELTQSDYEKKYLMIFPPASPKHTPFDAFYITDGDVYKRQASDGSFILVYLTDNETGFLLELTWLKDHTAPYELSLIHLLLRERMTLMESLKMWISIRH